MSAAQFCQKPARSCAIVTKSKRSTRLPKQQREPQEFVFDLPRGVFIIMPTHMSQDYSTNIRSISKARTLEEIGEFWDTHSLDDYWDQTHEVEFEVRARQRRRVTLAPEIYERIASQAQLRGLMPETLVNLWLAERLQAAS